jgi:hypothetical protein
VPIITATATTTTRSKRGKCQTDAEKNKHGLLRIQLKQSLMTSIYCTQLIRLLKIRVVGSSKNGIQYIFNIIQYHYEPFHQYSIQYHHDSTGCQIVGYSFWLSYVLYYSSTLLAWFNQRL